MESNNKLKQINIKNHTCQIFDDIVTINDIDLDIILTAKKLYENILIYDEA